MEESIKDLIKPELLVLIPVLYFLGIGLKKSNVSNNHIPVILGIIGIVLATIYVLASSNSNNYLEMIFAGITQGVLCAGYSVYTNQVFKQEVQGKSE